MKRLKSMSEIVEIHYTTGTYSLLVKVILPTMAGLYEFLSGKLQAFEDIQSKAAYADRIHAIPAFRLLQLED